MAKLPDSFNFGNADELTLEQFVIRVQRMYIDLAMAINGKPDLIQRQTDGQTDETFLSQGTVNINLATNKVEILTNHPTQSTVTWTTIS